MKKNTTSSVGKVKGNYQFRKHVAKLTIEEFKQLCEYTSAADNLLKDVIDKFKRRDSSPTECRKLDRLIDYSTFKHFLDAYLDADLPVSLCKHLFSTFLDKQNVDQQEPYHAANSEQKYVTASPSLISKMLTKRDSNSLSPMNCYSIDRSNVDLDRVPLKDVACYLSLLKNGRPEQKLEFMFYLYDKDGNGYLDNKEIANIIEQMMRVAVYLDWDTVELKPILEQMLKEIDYDEDGTVSLDEWVKGGMTTIPLLVLLGFDMNVRDDGSHIWRLAHFNRPAYCNLCLKLLVGFAGKQGLSCTFCTYTVHERCVHRAPNNCISTYVKSRKFDQMAHHWVEANRTEKCGKCKRKVRALEGKRCRWCRITLHSLCATQWTTECDLGSLSYHILPPTSIFPVVLKRSGNTRLNITRKKSSITAPLSFQIIPKTNTRPLLVFVNPKSGGKQGERLYRKFQGILNPRQVFNLELASPLEGLQMYSKVANLNVLCCGGDGTVGWLLDAMDKIDYESPESRPWVCVLPLGTGNDLARCLRWGGGYQNDNLVKLLYKIETATVAMLDRWQLNFTCTSMEEKGDPVPANIMNNYFSIGVDASIAHRFHQMREKYPERFNSRMKNKFWYFEFGTSETLQATCKHLHEHVEILCDNVSLNLAAGPSLEGIAFMNISSIYGGSNMWGPEIVKKKPNMPAKQSLIRKNLITTLWPFLNTDLLANNRRASSASAALRLDSCIQDMGDGLIEVVGIESAMSVGQVKAGLRSSGHRLAQCKEVLIRTYKRFPMQVDGEPWMQPRCEIALKMKNQVPVLVAPTSLKNSSYWWSIFGRKKRKSIQNIDESLILP